MRANIFHLDLGLVQLVPSLALGGGALLQGGQEGGEPGSKRCHALTDFVKRTKCGLPGVFDARNKLPFPYNFYFKSIYLAPKPAFFF